MTPDMWHQTMTELVSILTIVAIPSAATLVLLRRDKVRADRQKRVNR